MFKHIIQSSSSCYRIRSLCQVPPFIQDKTKLTNSSGPITNAIANKMLFMFSDTEKADIVSHFYNFYRPVINAVSRFTPTIIQENRSMIVTKSKECIRFVTKFTFLSYPIFIVVGTVLYVFPSMYNVMIFSAIFLAISSPFSI